MKNKKTLIAIIYVVSVILVLIGVTYAYWLVTKEQQGENVISSACLDISLNGSNDINLPDSFPMSDEDGMATTPYTFTVTNNCTTSVDYQVNLETLGEEEDTIIPSAIKIAINDEVSLLRDKVETTPTLSDAYTARKILTGTLAGKSDATTEDAVTYELRIWIDKDAPISEQNKTFTSKITVTIGQGIFNPIKSGTLAYSILESYGGLNNIEKVTNFSEAITPGIYKAPDDYGTSFYFRGVVNNNYFKLKKAKKYFVEGLDSNGNHYNYYESLESCEGNSYECIELNEPYVDYQNYTVWRIIRINGDGTIRMIIEKDSSNMGTYEDGAIVENLSFIYSSLGKVDYSESDLLEMINDFYTWQVEDYSEFIADSIFCNDKEISRIEEYEQFSAFAGANISFKINYYKAFDRLNSNNPKLGCTQSSDKMTVANGKLLKPIGLITADEAYMAGFDINTNNSYYKETTWTMTPYNFNENVDIDNPETVEFIKVGYLNDKIDAVFPGEENFEPNFRPVINLKSDIPFTGIGTEDSPYELILQ